MSLRWMDGLEIAAFLESRQTGVLGLGMDDRGYAVPISYAYQPDDQELYFRFGFSGESQKREYIEAASQVAFVVYDHGEAGWKSVMAIGPLELVSETTLDSTVIEAVNQVEIPFFSIHEASRGDLEFTIARLPPDSLTGVAEA